MNVLLFQLAIIFVPGMIWERIDALFVQKRRPDQFEVLRRSFIFGLITYLLTYGLYRSVGWKFEFFEFSENKAVLTGAIFNQIAVASLTALLASIPYLYIANRKLIPWFFNKIKATKRYGDEDVWDYLLNSRDASVEYVNIRDYDKQITYAGYVELFSETDRIRELVLKDAIVYNFDGLELYKTPRIYLARAMDNVDIEFPYIAQGASTNG